MAETIVILGFFLAVLAGFADVIGGYIAVYGNKRSNDLLPYFIATAAGFILGVTLLERMPEVVENVPNGLVLVLGGYLILYLTEGLFAAGAHKHPVERHEHEHGSHALVGKLSVGEPIISKPASLTALLGLLVHTFLDGAAIVAGFLISAHVGTLLFIAVMLHKIPEGLSTSAIMLASGSSKRTGFLAAVAVACSTVLGAVFPLALPAGSEGLIEAFLALATGTFLYIATTDLIPAANESRKRGALAFTLVGVGLFFVSIEILKAFGIAA